MAKGEDEVGEMRDRVKYKGGRKGMKKGEGEMTVHSLRSNTELESHALEAELRASRLEEQSVDHQTLLTTMAQDKETLSR